ncbi:hypothetical protein MRX96_024686 [Rhipicephalus microplus]
MKETTSSSFDASRAPGFQGDRLWTSMWDHVPPPGPLFASLLNTREDSRRMAGQASREHSDPTAAEQWNCCGTEHSNPTAPKMGRVNFQAGTGHPNQSSHPDSVTQDQTSTRSSPTTSVTSSMASSGVVSATSAKMALSGDRRRAIPSETARQSHSLPLQGVSKDADTKELSETCRNGPIYGSFPEHTEIDKLRTGETVPTAKRFTLVRTVRLATATRATATKNPSVTALENPVVDTTEVAADGQGSVAVVSYATAKEEEVEEMRRHRGQQA